MTRTELYNIYKSKAPIEWDCLIIKKFIEYLDNPEELKEICEAMNEGKKLANDIRIRRILMDEQFWNEEI